MGSNLYTKMTIRINKNNLDKKQIPLYFEALGAKIISKNHRGNQYKYEIEVLDEQIKLFLKEIRKTEIFEYLTFKDKYIFTELINLNQLIWDKFSICKIFNKATYGMFHNKFDYYNLAELVYLLDNKMITIEVIDFLEKIEDTSVEKLEVLSKRLAGEAIDLKMNIQGLYGLSSNTAYILSGEGEIILNEILQNELIDDYYLITNDNDVFSIVYKFRKTEKYKNYLRNKRNKIDEFKNEILNNKDTRKTEWDRNREKKYFDIIPKRKNCYHSVVRWINNQGNEVIGLFASTVYDNETPEEVFDYKYKKARFMNIDNMGRKIKDKWIEKVNGIGEYIIVYQTKVTKEEVRYEFSGIPLEKAEFVKNYTEEEIVDYITNFHKTHCVNVNIRFNNKDSEHNANAQYDPQSNTITYHTKMLYITIIRNMIELKLYPEETLTIIAAHESGHASKELFPMYEQIENYIKNIPDIKEFPLSFGEIDIYSSNDSHLKLLNKVVENLGIYSEEVILNEFNAWKYGRKYVPDYLKYSYDNDNWNVITSYIYQEESNLYMIWLWKKNLENKLLKKK